MAEAEQIAQKQNAEAHGSPPWQFSWGFPGKTRRICAQGLCIPSVSLVCTAYLSQLLHSPGYSLTEIHNLPPWQRASSLGLNLWNSSRVCSSGWEPPGRWYEKHWNVLHAEKRGNMAKSLRSGSVSTLNLLLILSVSKTYPHDTMKPCIELSHLLIKELLAYKIVSLH